MPVIKARAQKQTVRHIGRLFRDNHESLWAYATMIDEDPDYVVNQLIETTLCSRRGARIIQARMCPIYAGHAPGHCFAPPRQARAPDCPPRNGRDVSPP